MSFFYTQDFSFSDVFSSFLARDVIYRPTSRTYAMMPVRLSVTEVHWRIIVNFGFKFRSHFTAHCGGRAACGRMISRHAKTLVISSVQLRNVPSMTNATYVDACHMGATL